MTCPRCGRASASPTCDACSIARASPASPTRPTSKALRIARLILWITGGCSLVLVFQPGGDYFRPLERGVVSSLFFAGALFLSWYPPLFNDRDGPFQLLFLGIVMAAFSIVGGGMIVFLTCGGYAVLQQSF